MPIPTESEEFIEALTPEDLKHLQEIVDDGEFNRKFWNWVNDSKNPKIIAWAKKRTDRILDEIITDLEKK